MTMHVDPNLQKLKTWNILKKTVQLIFLQYTFFVFICSFDWF